MADFEVLWKEEMEAKSVISCLSFEGVPQWTQSYSAKTASLIGHGSKEISDQSLIDMKLTEQKLQWPHTTGNTDFVELVQGVTKQRATTKTTATNPNNEL